MEREDILKFSNTIILLSKLLIRIEDKFLVQKLHWKLCNLLATFIAYNDASHNVSFRNLLNSIDGTLDYLELLAHNLKSDATPLLLAEKNLLKLKLHIFKKANFKETSKRVSAQRVIKPLPLVSDMPTIRSEFKNRSTRSTLKSDSSKERIYNFIKKFPDIRTKAIIDEFNALSDRTVKRNLKELTDEGFLKKKSENGAVYYLAAEIN